MVPLAKDIQITKDGAKSLFLNSKMTVVSFIQLNCFMNSHAISKTNFKD